MKRLIKDELQAKAVTLACSPERLVAITGQAGTGKTTIMKEVHERYTDAGHVVALAAPTGKAAKRISEATGIPAMTVHRLLEFTHPGDPDEKTGKPVAESHPRRHDRHKLEQTVVLVDEYSMVNHKLNRQLIDAMPAGALLRTFGDINQLPPIEEFVVSTGPSPDGSPFRHHITRHPSVTLKNIYRQGEGSSIVKNAHRILNRMCPVGMEDFNVVLTRQQGPQVLRLVESDLNKYMSLDNQIITPTHRGWIGTRELNLKIQAIVQSSFPSEGHIMPRHSWDKYDLVLYPGDKVIWTKNDYCVEIFNGETGIVKEFLGRGHVVIDFGDRVVSVPPLVSYEKSDGSKVFYDPRVSIKLAYAITTHASQGSEYDSVVYLMDKYAMMLQDQSNFYTGVTRAKKRATVIADQWSFQKAVITKPAFV
jgi:exodeoxyribonuclease V alpha subunit